MFVKANYLVEVGENDFPVVGEIGVTEIDGKDYSLIVKEIINLEWEKSTGVPALLVRVIVELDEKDFVNREQPKKDKKVLISKFRIIEGGKTRG